MRSRSILIERFEDRVLLAGLVSDSFSSPVINTELWSFVDPVGDTSLSVRDGDAEIVIPAGRSHDLWTNSLLAPRLLQNADDEDFEVEVKFDSVLSQRYQIQGIVAQQDFRNLVRFDIHHDGNSLRLFSATITNGIAHALKNVTVQMSAPIYLRMARSGSTWTLRYSDDGFAWNTHASFAHRLSLNQIGPFAANHNPSPAHTASIDHFFNTAEPVLSEAGPAAPDNQNPVANDDYFEADENTPLVVSAPGLLTNDTDADSDTLRVVSVQGSAVAASVAFNEDGSFSYDPGDAFDSLGVGETAKGTFAYVVNDGNGGTAEAEVTVLVRGVNDPPAAEGDRVTTAFNTPVFIDALSNDRDPEGAIDATSVTIESGPTNGSLSLDAATDTFLYAPNDGFSGEDRFAYSVADGLGLRSNVATVVVDVSERDGPNIQLWYDSDQSFGKLGRPQEWINVLGNVSDPDGIGSLSYALNDGPVRMLSIGHDLRRLVGVGDFNVEIDADDLREGLNVVRVTAIDRLGNATIRSVNVHYTRGNEWSLPYEIDWDTVEQVNDVAQVVDGRWELVPGGVRSVETGYDRLIAVGDMNWQNYQVTAEITVNGIPNLPFGDAGGDPAIGLLMRWKGHNETSPHRAGDQPRVGYSPFGSLAWYRFASNPSLQLTDNVGIPVERDNSGFVLRQGVTYMFRAQVLTTADGHNYTLQVWQKGEPESTAVRLQTVRPLGEFDSGSLLLVSHKVDATFGKVVVTRVAATTPSIDPPSGSFADSIQISLSTPTPSAAIRYTLDGTEPTDSDLIYSEPFTIDESMTVKARAFVDGLLPSSTATAEFTKVAEDSTDAIVSDDFSSETLNSDLWVFQDPRGDTSVAMTGSAAEIIIPGSRSHDLWTDRLFSPRLLQPVVDGDFEVEAKYASQVTSRYQIQGLLAQQDSRNLVRFDVYHDGSTARLFAAKIVNGRATAIANSPITLNAPIFLRLERSGNTWSARYSTDGQAWTTHSNFVHALQLRHVGLFAGNHASRGASVPEFRAVVDHFWNTAAPIPSTNNEDLQPPPPNATPVGRDDEYVVGEDNRWELPAPGVLGNDEDSNGDALELIAVDDSGIRGRLSWNSDGSLIYDPDGQFEYLGEGQVAEERFVYTVSDSKGGTDRTTVTMRVSGRNDAPVASDDRFFAEAGTEVLMQVLSNDVDAENRLNSSSVEIVETPTLGTVTADPVTGVLAYQAAADVFGEDQLCYAVRDETGQASNKATVRIQVRPPAAGLVSDDFSGESLNEDVWRFVDPRGDSALSMTGDNASIFVPGGASHDLWTDRLWAPRLLQETSDEDFSVEAKFVSRVSTRYQLQGLVAQQDSRNLVRFDTYHDGSSAKVFVAVIINGSARRVGSASVAPDSSQYFRLSRVGDRWTASYSGDGTDWSTLAAFGHGLELKEVGAFVGNHGSSPAASPDHTGLIDYFRNVLTES